MSEQPTVVVRITKAERYVLDELMRDGAGNREIAARLNLSEQTVRSHIKRILAAAGCQSRTALVVAIARRTVRITVVNRTVRACSPIKHGTAGGYRAHLYRADEPCEPCTEAAREQGRHMVRVQQQRAAS